MKTRDQLKNVTKSIVAIDGGVRLRYHIPQIDMIRWPLVKPVWEKPACWLTGIKGPRAASAPSPDLYTDRAVVRS